VLELDESGDEKAGFPGGLDRQYTGTVVKVTSSRHECRDAPGSRGEYDASRISPAYTVRGWEDSRMDQDIYDAIVKAAYEAWATDEIVPVDGLPIIVMPDAVLDSMTTWLQSRKLRLVEPASPTLWIEHQGKRAQVAWHTGPPIERNQG
jgi:hypothetical protein